MRKSLSSLVFLGLFFVNAKAEAKLTNKQKKEIGLAAIGGPVAAGIAYEVFKHKNKKNTPPPKNRKAHTF